MTDRLLAAERERDAFKDALEHERSLNDAVADRAATAEKALREIAAFVPNLGEQWQPGRAKQMADIARAAFPWRRILRRPHTPVLTGLTCPRALTAVPAKARATSHARLFPRGTRPGRQETKNERPVPDTIHGNRRPSWASSDMS